MKEFHYAFSNRKAALLEGFLNRPVHRLGPCTTVEKGDRVYVWGDGKHPELAPGVELVRVEDGFIRSVGLGAAFAAPLSWVFDTRGLHHQGHIETDLEVLIRNADNDVERTRRGAEIGRRIRELGITKYNVGSREWRPSQSALMAPSRILVVGQVANDAALRSIVTPVRSNMDLLREARERNPDAYIIYKRHPDVVAGLRDGRDEDAMAYADIVVTDASVDAVLPHVDSVHVMTSLTGFEALIRGKTVFCYAWPFYSGWGLTSDIYENTRRGVQRSLDQVLWAALVAYPRYRNPGTGMQCSPEEAIDHVASSARHGDKAQVPQQFSFKLLAGRLLKALGITDRTAA